MWILAEFCIGNGPGDHEVTSWGVVTCVTSQRVHLPQNLHFKTYSQNFSYFWEFTDCIKKKKIA